MFGGNRIDLLYSALRLLRYQIIVKKSKRNYFETVKFSEFSKSSVDYNRMLPCRSCAVYFSTRNAG